MFNLFVPTRTDVMLPYKEYTTSIFVGGVIRLPLYSNIRVSRLCRRTVGFSNEKPSRFATAVFPQGKTAPCWVVDFACKINSLQIRTTSGWPNLFPRKSGVCHFFDTLDQAQWPSFLFLFRKRLHEKSQRGSLGPSGIFPIF